jgi:hypothetical protein
MLRRRRFAIVAALVGWLFITSATGCAMMGQNKPQKKDGPTTVEGWMKQPRVQP